MGYQLIRIRRIQLRTLLAPLAALALTGACRSEGPQADVEVARAEAVGGPPFETVADVQELMLHILEPAAQDYWEAVGWIVDSTGTREIRPESDHDWEHVLHAAYVVAEAGNLLMMDGRAPPDDGPWIGMSQAMIEVSRRAIAAAAARDEAAVFEAGGELYYTCTACHSVYAVETLRPGSRIQE